MQFTDRDAIHRQMQFTCRDSVHRQVVTIVCTKNSNGKDQLFRFGFDKQHHVWD